MQRIVHRLEYDIDLSMKGKYSTREAADRLGIALVTLQGHVAKKTFPAPPLARVGGIKPGRKKKS